MAPLVVDPPSYLKPHHLAGRCRTIALGCRSAETLEAQVGFGGEDLVNRQFSRDGPNRLSMTDITEHPTREGKLYCCAVLDAWSRKVVGWYIDRRPTAAMVNSALAMAVTSRIT